MNPFQISDGFFSMWRKQSLFPLLLTLFTLCTFYAVFGVYFESSERWGAPMIHGILTEAPFGIWFIDNHFLQMPVLGYVSSLFPSLPIYGMWHAFLMFLYVWLWFLLCFRLTGAHIQNMVWRLLASTFFVWSVLGVSLVYVYFMRASILIASASLLLYLDYFMQGKRKPIFIGLFLLGCSMRVSSALMVLFVITVLGAVCLKRPILLFRTLALPWVMASACMVVVLLNKAYSGNDGLKMEQTLEYAILDRQAIKPISAMTTAEDSMRYRGFMEYFLITDSTQITFDFVKNLVDYDKLNPMGINGLDAEHLRNTSLPWLLIYKWFLIINYCALILLSYGRSRKMLLGQVCVHMAAWAVVVAIGMKINMYDYFIGPWMTMLFGASYLLVFRDTSSPFFAWQKAVAVVFPLAACIQLWPLLHGISETERNSNMQASEYLQRLEKLSQNSIPLIWVQQTDFLPSEIFSRKETEVLRKCEYMCMYFYAYYPFVQTRCKERLGFSFLDWAGMNRALKARRDEICFVMWEGQPAFLDEYYRVLYDLDFVCERDTSQTELLPGASVYRLAGDSLR